LDVIDCDARQNYYPAGVAIVVEKRCMKTERKSGLSRIVSIFTENFGLSWSLSLVVVCFISLVTCFAVYWFIHSAPPRILTITSGPPGSTFERNAGKYRTILARNGVTLNIIPSQGSLENLQRLESPTSRVDVGFVQGGVADGTNTLNLISLGNIAYEPLLIFYRGGTNVRLLSGLAGKRLAIGSEGSGAHSLALTLLQTNGLTTDGVTKLLDLDADAAAQQLLAGTVDAVFMMSDSASSQTMRILLRSPGVELLSFEQADAYTRRFNYLNKLRLPEGSIDFGKNLPVQDVWLIGPTVELVARPNLNAAVSDLLLEAAQEVHGNASMLQNQGEFPNPVEHEFKISPDAGRYYKSGKSFLYRKFPFWIASLANRILVAFIPMMLVLIPGLRLIPAAYKWRIQLRLYRWYRALLVLERELVREITPAKREEMNKRLDEIEKAVKRIKVPASFADRFYGLRGHIDYVREKLAKIAT
jgi:TRAP-type uncharacterized transport system substrate-binding protein